MSNFLIILAIIAIAIYKQATKEPKKRPSKQPKTTVPFPIESVEEAENVVEKVQPAQLIKPARRVSKPRNTPPPVSPDFSCQPRSGIRFRTPSEARKAFIYSEIFKRKY